MTAPEACDACLARSWLLTRLAGHIDLHRDRLDPLLALPDCELIAALAGARRDEIGGELRAFSAADARARAAEAGVEQLCRCRPEYPRSLTALDAPPAVLHVTSGIERFLALAGRPAVAIVGARRPSPYGLDVARSLARGMAAAGLTVISGMALGIDTAAHRGALDANGATIAVLAAGPDRAYPRRARALHAQIIESGAAASELPPGTGVRRWMFPARNRLIAALARLTVVVEARLTSGAMLTAGHAAALGRVVGAVPGRITSPLARGPHRLLLEGALLVSGAEDLLDGVFGLEARPFAPALPRDLQALLDALAEGRSGPAAVARAGLDPDQGLAALASLELAGRTRREPGGGYSVLLR